MFVVGILWASVASAQPPQESALPNPKLSSTMPSGGRVGTSFELSFAGSDLEEPQGLLFSHPGIKGEPIIPPAPPVDPKKPTPPPPASKPPVTKFKVTIAPDAAVGIHDVRFVGKWGVSNPRAFVVGDIAEVLEKEPNDDVDKAQRIDVNTTVNGVISSPTDVDYFVFAGKKGQRIIASCLSSTIDSRLSAALELYDSAGRKLCSNRNYHANDALLDCALEADGDYYVRLFEFTHTLGDAECFYRLSISTLPWIDAVHPCVVAPGKAEQLTVYGRNLPGGKLDPTAVIDGRILEKVQVSFPVPSDPGSMQRLAFLGKLEPKTSGLDGLEYRIRNVTGASNPFLLTYARAPVVLDNEGNDTPESAQEVTVPCEIAGRIEKRHDRDYYVFQARQGDAYNIQLFAERLGVSTDMYFVVKNLTSKEEIGEFDDNSETLTPTKFFTRSADPPVHRFVAPADGKYQVMVTSREAVAVAGPHYVYRLSIAPEQPDFRLILMAPADNHPDACRLLQGGNQYYTVLAWRPEGWNGTINLSAEGLPPGVTCAPQSVGTGVKQTQLVISASLSAPLGTCEFKVKGTANIHGQTVTREARAATITWPVQPALGIPLISRLDRNLVLAVREQAPYNLTASIDREVLIQGEKTKLSLQLTRLWPDFKTPLQATAVDLPPNVTINNNKPITMAPDKNAVTVPVSVGSGALPGTYNLVLRTSAQVPFNKDSASKQKSPINVVLPSSPVSITVIPKQVGSISLADENVTAKIGAQSAVVVKVTRMYEFGGEFRLHVVLPSNAKGITAEPATIPAGKDEAKIFLKIAPDVALGNKPDFVLRAIAVVNGNVPTIQEAKFNLNVVK